MRPSGEGGVDHLAFTRGLQVPEGNENGEGRGDAGYGVGGVYVVLQGRVDVGVAADPGMADETLYVGTPGLDVPVWARLSVTGHPGHYQVGLYLAEVGVVEVEVVQESGGMVFEDDVRYGDQVQQQVPTTVHVMVHRSAQPCSCSGR